MTTAAVEELYPAGAQHPALLELLLSLCRFQRQPTRWVGGRVALHELPEPLASSTGLAALKLKGLGRAPHDGLPALPPSEEIYDRWNGQEPDLHLGIEHTGEFCLRDGDPAPVGGLALVGARRELACAAALERRGAAAVRPVAVVSLCRRSFAVGSARIPLGVAVTGLEAVLERCSSLVPGWPLPARVRLREHQRLAAAFGVAEHEGTRAGLTLLGEAYRRFGRALRCLESAGWYRYSGHPDNFSIDDGGRAVLIDLDSCRSLEDLPAGAAALEIVRDGMSALYNLMCTFFRPSVMQAIDDELLSAHEPFSAFIDAWEPASSGGNAEIGTAIAKYAIAARRRLRHFQGLLEGGDPAAAHLYRYVRHDRDLTYGWLMRLLYRRGVAAGCTMPFTLRELDERLLRFMGRPRFEAMHALELVERRTTTFPRRGDRAYGEHHAS